MNASPATVREQIHARLMERLQPSRLEVLDESYQHAGHAGANGTGFFADPKEQLVVAFGTAAPGDLRKYYREQMQDLIYGALTK